MHPPPGERLLRFVGDSVRFTVRGAGGAPLPNGFKAMLRTNLGRAAVLHQEIIQSRDRALPFAGASWRDLSLNPSDGEWLIDLRLTEVGFFSAKAYAIDDQGRQFWPDGPNVGIAVHPNEYRTSNTIYCAFTRLFGETTPGATPLKDTIEPQIAKLESQGYTVIPPSGKIRDLIRHLPHIIDTLGCRILHLLPVNPVPTTLARFGRYGSPYAALDLTAIDPALIDFDRQTTGVEQFRELTYAVHLNGGRVFLDIVTNHTGWSSNMHENHPEWFLRDDEGNFVSPGAWGVTWTDLVELDHRTPAAWDHLAEVFIIWCRRGVDGFRCDAGYKVPMSAWRYVVARVRQEFPDTVFLLEGLGGSWEATETLLTDGGMQWAYSELFQNYSGQQVSSYLDYALRQSRRIGLYIHYSETHDNDRLAKRGRAWSLLRNRLCALTSVSGGFGFTCGVEWLAAEKINVHSRAGLSWGETNNLIAELSSLNSLLREHPCFFDDATLTRLSRPDSSIFVLRRASAEGLDHVLILANLDIEHTQTCAIKKETLRELGELRRELLGQPIPRTRAAADDQIEFILPPGSCCCLSAHSKPVGLSGEKYRRARSAAAWGFAALSRVWPTQEIGACDWRALAELVEKDPSDFLAAVPYFNPRFHNQDIKAAFDEAISMRLYPSVVTWRRSDRTRVTLVPPSHWLLILDDAPFRATLSLAETSFISHAKSTQVHEGFVCAFAPQEIAGDATLVLERFSNQDQHLDTALRYLPANPNESLRAAGLAKNESPGVNDSALGSASSRNQLSTLVLLTNGIGGMARLAVDLGQIQSKYDCLLGANLHSSVPIDRHIFAKRARVWANADGFISPLDSDNLIRFDPGPPAHWRFVVNAGDFRTVEIELEADMLEFQNATIFRFRRSNSPPPFGRPANGECDVRLIIRVDIEDRNFHWETKRNPSLDQHFTTHCRPLRDQAGFEFTPASDRRFRVFADPGRYHHEAEWCENIPHPVEKNRGQNDSGDAYSPGWFELQLRPGEDSFLVVTAEAADPPKEILERFKTDRLAKIGTSIRAAGLRDDDEFGKQLVRAAQSFIVRRESAKTIIAGYPWFLDWGRDSLISARGLLAAGMHDEVRQLLITFGRFEENGTLPNIILGEDASNRDTSDAPLWYGVVCEEAAALLGKSLYEIPVDKNGRTVANVLRGIAEGYRRGTSNGIRVDAESGLVWSPKHFTWMDTNHPAGTPRVGYPIEIQALWIRLLRQLARLGVATTGEGWDHIADRAQTALTKHFWIEDRGYYSDLLIAPNGESAAHATRDDALRNNCLFAISLDLVTSDHAKRCIHAAARHLVVPGALRSLAPLPVSPPMPIYGNDGQLLNDPPNPYWPRYEGDEDTRRKPAYHNGTAWTWTFPSFCEAVARAWDFQPESIAAARAYLGSMKSLFQEGCLGQIPEILDGDAPHTQRGCDAQAWGVTEALRVWKLLSYQTDNSKSR